MYAIYPSPHTTNFLTTILLNLQKVSTRLVVRDPEVPRKTRSNY
ncbi:uncharacterized protein LALA0_S05e04654g [Lachancea lanzarotensis]|uniref:LALA0S05e04654g1_1 n=1 Tax=Lachancea lanzarotensis TaxID=1245769 RepID=A0A0C7MXG6_9SACH|nr:uncharacterized protein LALA0_S05e04654g [Lachancea lanzarotensis]CEP62394.1 LALA0S05e04654g1_1 [Lachancea lanzarotensis]